MMGKGLSRGWRLMSSYLRAAGRACESERAPLPTAGRRHLVVVVAATPNYLRQASQNLGKYIRYVCVFTDHSSSTLLVGVVCVPRSRSLRSQQNKQTHVQKVPRRARL